MIAVDTNILIYACDQADPRRQTIALDLYSEDLPGFEDFEGTRVVNPFAQTPRPPVASQWAEDPRE